VLESVSATMNDSLPEVPREAPRKDCPAGQSGCAPRPPR
jgi:hypothetical protein